MRRFALIASLVLPLALVACGTDEEIPSAATPSPTPTVAPAPTPAPTPAGFSCPLPPGSNPSLNCGKGTPRLSEAVNMSIDALMVKFPSIFNLNDLNGGNPKVVNPVRYYEELVNELGRTWSVCTKVQAEEISIKYSNDMSEDWIVLTSGNYVRRRYQGTCTPAWW
jgi:hypothetical protein